MGSKGGHKYNTTTYWVHRVSEYTGLNFLEVWSLNYIVYLTLRRDAFRMEQTEPDREALRKKLRKEGGKNGG